MRRSDAAGAMLLTQHRPFRTQPLRPGVPCLHAWAVPGMLEGFVCVHHRRIGRFPDRPAEYIRTRKAHLPRSNCDQCIEHFIACLQQEPSQDFDCGPGLRCPEYERPSSCGRDERKRSLGTDEPERSDWAELHATPPQRPEIPIFPGRREVSEITQLGPFIHNAPLDRKVVLTYALNPTSGAGKSAVEFCQCRT